jgi:CheY-like chemotaxis protein
MNNQHKILVIEDDEDIRESLKELLEDSGYEVVCMSNGQHGLDHLRSGQVPPKLILLDLMMPVMDGHTFRVEQKNDPKLASIPVVIMTADGQVAAKKASADAQAFLRKPVNIDTVLEVVSRFCN